MSTRCIIQVMILTLLFLSTLATTVLIVRLRGRVKKYEFSGVPAVGNDLPSVSVCIAARNETHALAQCLERVLKSDYQKLEVLVLDDSSTDDTSLIIKSFANAGVRFIAGSELPAGWLGKNHAYRTLIDEASGDMILFIDVDTMLSRDSIARLVDSMLSPKRSMISVLPLRTDNEHPSSLFGTMRYHWELLLGNATSPASASALWMIKKQVFQDPGLSLTNYGMSTRLERHLAKQLSKRGGYRFYMSNRSLGISYEKRLTSQWETAIRLYYPMIGNNMLAWLGASIFIALLIAPFIIAAFTVSTDSEAWVLWLMMANIVTITLLSRKLFGPAIWRMRLLLTPIHLIQELVLLSMSFVRHITHTVTWKGRSISAQPVSHDKITINE